MVRQQTLFLRHVLILKPHQLQCHLENPHKKAQFKASPNITSLKKPIYSKCMCYHNLTLHLRIGAFAVDEFFSIYLIIIGIKIVSDSGLRVYYGWSQQPNEAREDMR